ncbi:MAG: ABC transporter permease [Gaiellaceae bacterium]
MRAVEQHEVQRPVPLPAPESATTWTENRPSRTWLPSVDFGELWSYRDLALILALKDLKVRYKQTFLGVLWVVVQPLLGVAIFTIFLGRLAGLTGAGYPYPLFVYTGLIAWLYISGGVSAAAASLVEQRALLTKVYFPRLLAPMAAVVPALVDLAVAIAVAAVFLVVYDASPSLAILVLPAWVAAAVVLALAVGTWLAALNVKYRDVRHALAFSLQVWFFASPVVFPSSIVSDGWEYVYAVNPTVGVIDGFRWSLASGPFPGPDVLVSLAVIPIVLAAGVVYFRRVERGFADIV